LGITRDTVGASGANQKYGHEHIGLHWEDCGHPDKGSSCLS